MKVLLVLCCALAIFTSSTNDERAVENIDNLPSTTKEKLDAGTNACAPTPTHEHSERRSQSKDDEQHCPRTLSGPQAKRLSDSTDL